MASLAPNFPFSLLIAGVSVELLSEELERSSRACPAGAWTTLCIIPLYCNTHFYKLDKAKAGGTPACKSMLLYEEEKWLQ